MDSHGIDNRKTCMTQVNPKAAIKSNFKTGSGSDWADSWAAAR